MQWKELNDVYPPFSLAKGKHNSFCAVGCTNRYTKGFQQFVMTLMKLRLNLRDQDLAYRFELISQLLHDM